MSTNGIPSAAVRLIYHVYNYTRMKTAREEIDRNSDENFHVRWARRCTSVSYTLFDIGDDDDDDDDSNNWVNQDGTVLV